MTQGKLDGSKAVNAARRGQFVVRHPSPGLGMARDNVREAVRLHSHRLQVPKGRAKSWPISPSSDKPNSLPCFHNPMTLSWRHDLLIFGKNTKQEGGDSAVE